MKQVKRKCIPYSAFADSAFYSVEGRSPKLYIMHNKEFSVEGRSPKLYIMHNKEFSHVMP